MNDDSQIIIPRSFIELFIPPGRIKPTEAAAHIAERYELCEDLAQALVDRAADRRFELGITEADVLVRMRDALMAGPGIVSASEAVWVIHRLAELLEWPMA